MSQWGSAMQSRVHWLRSASKRQMMFYAFAGADETVARHDLRHRQNTDCHLIARMASRGYE